MKEKLKNKLNQFKSNFKYKSNKDKLVFFVFVLFQIQILVFFISYFGNYIQYKNDIENYKTEKYKLLVEDKNNTLINNDISKLIKDKEKIDHIEFISKDKFITPYVFLKNNMINKYEQMFAYSVSTNIEPILIKNKIPYTWKLDLDKKYLKPKLITPNFIFFDFIKEHILTILLYSVLIYYVLRSMPSIGESKFKEFKPEDLKKSLSDLAGIDIEIKNEINQLKDLIHNKNNYIRYGIGETFNILFSGPPGVGKTVVAMSLAKELNVPMVIGTGNVETGFVGGGPSTIKKLFKKAEELAFNNKSKTCIIFLDEAQVLLLKRGNQREKWADDAANELLDQLEGVNSVREVNIIFIAASNFDDSNFQIDEAMERRFKKKIYFRLPDLKERIEIINLYIDNIDQNLVDIKKEDIDILAKMFTKLSPAKIETIVKEASLLAARSNGKVDLKLLRIAFERIVVGYTNRDSSKEDNRKRIILHELGHFIIEFNKYKNMGLDLNEIEKRVDIIKISSESISKYGALGYVLNEVNDDLKTKLDYEMEIISLYGGFAAEAIFYKGDFYQNVSSGPYNDIQKATAILKKMYFEFGFYKKSKLNILELSKEVNSHDIENVENISETLFHKSKNIVFQNKDLIEFLSEILLKEWVLYKEDLFKYIKKYEAKKDF